MCLVDQSVLTSFTQLVALRTGAQVTPWLSDALRDSWQNRKFIHWHCMQCSGSSNFYLQLEGTSQKVFCIFADMFRDIWSRVASDLYHKD